MSFGAAWPACAAIWFGLFDAAAACSSRRSLTAWAQTAAVGLAAGAAVLWVVAADAVLGVVAADAVLGAVAADAVLRVVAADAVPVVLDFDEPQAATDTTTVDVNRNRASWYRKYFPFPALATAV